MFKDVDDQDGIKMTVRVGETSLLQIDLPVLNKGWDVCVLQQVHTVIFRCRMELPDFEGILPRSTTDVQNPVRIVQRPEEASALIKMEYKRFY